MNGLRLGVILFVTISAVISDDQAKCPCALKPDGTCWSYESKYLALDVDEAVASFPDLSMLDPPDPMDTDYPKECVTEECEVCQWQLKQRLCKIGFAKFNLTDQPPYENVTCKRYNLKDDENINWCAMENNSSDSNSAETVTHSMRRTHVMHGQRVIPHEATRTSMLGTRHLIKCATRGQEEDANGYISMCSSCWAWRELPSEYFPSLINELICLDSDGRCLSGHAKCFTGFHTANVLRNVSGVMQPVNINIATYCECKTMVGSAVYSLVVG